MTGFITMTQHSVARRRVPFTVLFKAVVGYAVAGLIFVGAILAFVPALHAYVELALQAVATLMGAVAGAYLVTRTARNASSK